MASMQSPASSLRQVVYTSVLAPELGVEAIAPIMQLSRLRNPSVGLTGALLFDGARFTQLLEGDPAVVGALIDRIARDPRHNEFTSIHDATTLEPRRCANWVAGYVEADRFDAFEASIAVGSADPLTGFVELLRKADVI